MLERRWYNNCINVSVRWWRRKRLYLFLSLSRNSDGGWILKRRICSDSYLKTIFSRVSVIFFRFRFQIWMRTRQSISVRQSRIRNVFLMSVCEKISKNEKNVSNKKRSMQRRSWYAYSLLKSILRRKIGLLMGLIMMYGFWGWEVVWEKFFFGGMWSAIFFGRIMFVWILLVEKWRIVLSRKFGIFWMRRFKVLYVSVLRRRW